MKCYFPITLSLAALLVACASPTPPSSPTLPPPPATQDIPAQPVPTAPIPAKPPATPTPPSAAQVRQLLGELLPKAISDRQGWISDLYTALNHLKIPANASNICAVAAVIEQESSWQADPVVPGLSKIVWTKIAERAQGYNLPLGLIKTALLKTSANGLSFKERIDRLRTEREMNDLFEELAQEAQNFGLPINIKNPIRTGGPMQVSIEFAQAHSKVWPYPYPGKNLRKEVFTRRGGVYFGTAILLQYPAPYSKMLYRFADFNAGRYSSRNAALQALLNRLTGQNLALDGDLLQYQNGKAIPSGSYRALLRLSGKLNMSAEAILRDLRLEKNASFAQSELYRKLYAFGEQSLGSPQPRELIPQIKLQSPKITRKLTTAWFAQRVDSRYQSCLTRQKTFNP